MRSIVFIFYLVGLAACANLESGGNAFKQVPPASWIDCCWQSEELLEINHESGQMKVLAVVARADEGLRVVMLDSLGRVLISISQTGSSGTLEISGQLPASLSAEELMLGIYLRYASQQDWASLGLALTQTAEQSELTSASGLLVSMSKLEPSDQLELFYPRSDIRIRVSPIDFQEL